MNKIKKLLKSLVIIILLGLSTYAITAYATQYLFTGEIEEINEEEEMYGASVLFPYQGGTGNGTPPTAGQMLIGNSDGIYELVASSTLGNGGGVTTFWASTTDGLAIHPTDTTDVVILGANATTTDNVILDAVGFINTGALYGYKQDGNTILVASSTNFGTFVGDGAGASLADGLYNTFLGYQAGFTATSSDSNTFIGFQAGYLATTSSRNSFIGFQAGYKANGDGNNMFGWRALYNNEGNSNNAFGTSALTNNTSGNGNQAFGIGTLQNNTTGAQNVAMGTVSLQNNISGWDNIGFGRKALFGNDTGSNNIGIGYQAGDTITSGSNNIIIGYDADATSSDSSYALNIGDTIYGDLNQDYIGIGTTTPVYTLDVYGNLRVDGDATTTNLTVITNSKLGTIESGTWNGTAIDFSDYTNATASLGLQINGDNIEPDSGYEIFLAASGTNWNTFYDTPSSVITAGDNISWDGNTLDVTAHYTDQQVYDIVSGTTTLPNLSTLLGLTSVGTIGTGVWEGTAIDNVRGGTGIDSSGLTGMAYIEAGTWSATSSPTGLILPCLGFNISTSTQDQNGDYLVEGATSTIDFQMPNASSTVLTMYGSTNAGTGGFGLGDGTATSSYTLYTTSPALTTHTANHSFTSGEILKMDVNLSLFNTVLRISGTCNHDQ